MCSPASGRCLALQDIPANLDRPHRRVQDARVRADSKPVSPARSTCARAVPSTCRTSRCRSTHVPPSRNSADDIDPNMSFLVVQHLGRRTAVRRTVQSELQPRPLSRPERHGGRAGAVRDRQWPRSAAGATHRFTPPDNPNWPSARAHLRYRLAACRYCAGRPDRGLHDSGHAARSTAEYPYLLARDALFASDFEGDRKRPAANVALQWAPNDTSEYTFEAFYQGYREEMFNNLHFTFADWWGALGPNPASTITLYPDYEPHQDAHRGFPVRLQQRRFHQAGTRTRSCTR